MPILELSSLIRNLEIDSQMMQSKPIYKSKRDMMIKKAVEDINELRKGTIFENRVETSGKLAKRINMNSFLAGKSNDGELEMVLKQCKADRNYAYLYFLLSNKKK